MVPSGSPVLLGTACEQEREPQISELRRVLGTGKGRGQQLLESRLEPDKILLLTRPGTWEIMESVAGGSVISSASLSGTR